MVLYNGHLNWKMGVVVLFGSSTPCQYFYYVYLFSLNMCHKSTKKRDGPLWLAQRKLVAYHTGYAGKSPLNLSYDNSFFKERSSAVGRADGPV